MRQITSLVFSTRNSKVRSSAAISAMEPADRVHIQCLFGKALEGAAELRSKFIGDGGNTHEQSALINGGNIALQSVKNRELQNAKFLPQHRGLIAMPETADAV